MSMAMTGAQTAGKTVLIGVMMRTFEHFLNHRHHTVLKPLHDTRERMDLTYPKIFLTGELPGGTPPVQPKPLLWSFQLRGRPICLALTDAAGEQFERLTPDDPTFAYLGAVDLLVSIVDPLKVPSIVAVLAGAGVSIPSHAGNDVDVLQKVLAARLAHARPDRAQYLGIALSKFDELQALRNHPDVNWRTIMNRPGAAMQRDPSFTSLFDDPRDSSLLQHELTGLLEHLHGGLLMALAADSGMAPRLFATAALGHRPTDRVHPAGVSPYRVLDLIKALWTIHGITS
ncbi:MAG: hypothetical protein IPJ14_17605 [Kineosporiaceae bacterium]|nr:hypothetical protein [Kineosporiaceae bacterium]